MPGDGCWPSQSDWNTFNQSVGGRLVATIPLASPCHNDVFAAYNATECQYLQNNWWFPDIHIATSNSIMAPFFANQSCDPFAALNASCVVGTLVQYSVNASSVSDCQKTIRFAQQHNIRLVIRNTGHDYYGKSTGAGGLAIWTHSLRNTSIIDYESPYYSGKAIKMGAGVQVSDAYAATHSEGLVACGGDSPSVGVAGGWTQGGGHGPLASRFGLGADQALEWEVVTAGGEYVVATPTNNYSDLYWALSGGGGGTYGVVYSLTSKAHTDMEVASANLTFTNEDISQSTFYAAVSNFLTYLPAIVDAGATSIWYLTNTSFQMVPTTAPGLTQAQLQKLMNPIVSHLDTSNITYSEFLS